MGLLDMALAPLRAVLNSAEHEVEHTFAVQDLEGIQSRVLETVEAIKDATEQIEAHVSVLETLATSITPLTQAVEKLTIQLGVITDALIPVTKTEEEVAKAEHGVARLGHLFGRHRQDADARPGSPPEGNV